MPSELTEFCQCAETLINTTNRAGHLGPSTRIVPPLQHNCEYVKLRNALHDRAMHEAYKIARDSTSRGDVPYLEISRQFSMAVDRLVMRAWRTASTAGYPEPGPERNRAFRDALIKLASGS